MTNHEQNKMMEEYIHLVHQVARRISAKAAQDYDAVQSGMICLLYTSVLAIIAQMRIRAMTHAMGW